MGGRGSNSKIKTRMPLPTPPATPSTPPQAVQPDDDDTTVQPNITPTAQAAQTANSQKFSDTDNSPFHDLYNGRQYYQDQSFGIDTRMAIQDYLHDQPTAGSMYSPSQQLNYAMKEGIPLTANQQFMKDSLMDGMHNLGYNSNLTRFARVDFMQNLGLPNFDKMPISQIQKALVGASFNEDGFISTSYNHFATAPNGGRPFTDKAVKINYKAPANTQALMPGNGPGGALGEIVLAPNQRYTITGVRFTGKQGRSGANMYKQIELDITIG